MKQNKKNNVENKNTRRRKGMRKWKKTNIHNSLAIPKLQYLLHTSLCFNSSTLQRHDNVLGSIVSSVVNIHLYSEDSSWTQATKTWKFLKELGRRVRRVTGEEKQSSFIYQKISVAVQHENAISILGGLPN